MKSLLMSADNRRQPRSNQRGSIVAIAAIGLLALLAVAGLALDGGHMLLNKTRLQNTVDASALSAAKTIDSGGDVATATTDAIATFALNASATGNGEMNAAYTAGDITVEVEYSDSLNPFTPDASLTEPAFVRVSVNTFPLPVWLSQIVGFTDKSVRASAVAGASPVLDIEACDVVPVMACGDSDALEVPGDPVTGEGAEFLGYNAGDVMVLKLSGGDDSTMGPGNFQILAIDGTGGDAYREAAAGNYENCISVGEADPEEGTEILSEPGVKSGPTSQGFNTRMGEYQGGVSSSDYPPDENTLYYEPTIKSDATGKILNANGSDYIPGDIGSPLYTYQDYALDTIGENCPTGTYSGGGCDYSIGKPKRRVLTVPIGNCAAPTEGRDMVEIYGFGCFFMIQPVNGGNDSDLYGQFVKKCDATGSFDETPDTNVGVTDLILYKDSASGDS